jgi:hypothetical protein
MGKCMVSEMASYAQKGEKGGCRNSPGRISSRRHNEDKGAEGTQL